jgi:superfamily II DNA/RNA helicase
MDQFARERAMKAFREGRTKVVVCTDVAARGIDVQDLTHVINYSLPRELDSYVHRIGRTGRSGKAGVALSLVTPSHMPLVGKIERLTKSKMRREQVPSRREVARAKLEREVKAFLAVDPARPLELVSEAWLSAIETMEKPEIVARFLALQNPELFSARAPREETEQASRPLPADRPAPRAKGFRDRAAAPAIPLPVPVTIRLSDDRPTFGVVENPGADESSVPAPQPRSAARIGRRERQEEPSNPYPPSAAGGWQKPRFRQDREADRSGGWSKPASRWSKPQQAGPAFPREHRELDSDGGGFGGGWSKPRRSPGWGNRSSGAQVPKPRPLR